jgi:rare lipoprotein A (peptidoglycan hydrolase)
MLVAIPPAQPAMPLMPVAIVEKVPGYSRSAVRSERVGHRGEHRGHPVDRRGHRVEHRSHRVARRVHSAGHRHRAGHRAGARYTYRPAEASWYGGGGSLACGGTLTSSTLGVANKTLPCGTWIVMHYHGHKVEVQVIDRGPYVAGREFDLTEATKRALGFGDLGEVWWRVR